MIKLSIFMLSIIILVNVILGFVVLFNDKKNVINRKFFYVTLSIALWASGIFVFTLAESCVLALYGVRIAFVAASLIIYCIFLFSLVFPQEDFSFNVFCKILTGIFPVFFVISSIFTSGVVNSVELKNWGWNAVYGDFHLFFIIYFFVFAGLSFYFFLKKYKRSKGVERVQFKFIFLGIILAIIMGSVTNLLVPLIFKSSILSKFGPLASIFIVGFTAYAILKHHLFDIKVIATEIFTFLISITMLVNALYSKNLFYEGLLKGGLFVATTFFGYLLIRSVLKEVEQKEKLSQLTTTLQKANEELRKLDDAKTEFISIASHQLRTPLTAIKGFVSMMAEGDYGKFSDEQDKVLEKVFASNERLIRLVDNLLDISRMEQGRMNYMFEKMSVGDLVANIVDELSQTAKMKKLKLQFVRPKKVLSQILGDEMKLRQVFMNLIDNAIKYTQQGSVEVKLEAKQKNIIFSVKDTGAGIAPHEQADLFKRFSRGTRIPKLHVGGSGLGLYVALKVTEAHHGKIWAESPGEGKGSTFFVSLPAG